MRYENHDSNFDMEDFMRYVCELCGYVYNPDKGDPENQIDAGTDFEDLPDTWCCPLCGATKDDFEESSDEEYDTTE